MEFKKENLKDNQLIEFYKQLVLPRLIEEKMLKIYAITMSILFFSIWIPAMVAVVREIINTFWR